MQSQTGTEVCMKSKKGYVKLYHRPESDYLIEQKIA